MTSSLEAAPAEFDQFNPFALDVDLPLNSRLAASRREQTEIEMLVNEILLFAPDYAEQLALDGLNRMRH